MNFIVAVDQNYGIGRENKLLTYLPEDLKYFKEKTLGKVVVFGRKTLETFPGGKPLSNRTSILLTTSYDLQPEGVLVAHSLPELFELLKKYSEEDIFIIGGALVYEQLIPYCKKGYITKIHGDFGADCHINSIEQQVNWKLVWESENKNYQDTGFHFTLYENTNPITY